MLLKRGNKLNGNHLYFVSHTSFALFFPSSMAVSHHLRWALASVPPPPPPPLVFHPVPMRYMVLYTCNLLTLCTICLWSLVTLSSSNGNVFIPGEIPIFNCATSSRTITITSVEWLINGTQLEDLSLTNVETEFSQLFRQGLLGFNNISVEYNNTNIQCRVTLSNGETVDSNNSTLLVQGERE